MADESIKFTVTEDGTSEVIQVLQQLGIAGDEATRRLASGYENVSNSQKLAYDSERILATARQAGVQSIQAVITALSLMTNGEVAALAASKNLAQTLQALGGGAAVGSSALAKVGAGAVTAAAQLGTLTSALAAVAGFKNLSEASDSVINLQNGLRGAGLSADQASGAFDRLVTLSKESGISVDDLGNNFIKVAIGAKNAGVSVNTALSGFEGFVLTVRETGSSAANAKEGLDQFARGIADGGLAVRQFNTLLYTTPGVVTAYTNAIGLNLAGIDTYNRTLETSREGVERLSLQQIKAAQADQNALDTKVREGAAINAVNQQINSNNLKLEVQEGLLSKNGAKYLENQNAINGTRVALQGEGVQRQILIDKQNQQVVSTQGLIAQQLAQKESILKIEEALSSQNLLQFFNTLAAVARQNLGNIEFTFKDAFNAIDAGLDDFVAHSRVTSIAFNLLKDGLLIVANNIGVFVAASTALGAVIAEFSFAYLISSLPKIAELFVTVNAAMYELAAGGVAAAVKGMASFATTLVTTVIPAVYASVAAFTAQATAFLFTPFGEVTAAVILLGTAVYALAKYLGYDVPVIDDFGKAIGVTAKQAVKDLGGEVNNGINYFNNYTKATAAAAGGAQSAGAAAAGSVAGFDSQRRSVEQATDAFNKFAAAQKAANDNIKNTQQFNQQNPLNVLSPTGTGADGTGAPITGSSPFAGGGGGSLGGLLNGDLTGPGGGPTGPVDLGAGGFGRDGFGSYFVPGGTGVDTVPFLVSPGEVVTVQTRSQQQRGVVPSHGPRRFRDGGIGTGLGVDLGTGVGVTAQSSGQTDVTGFTAATKDVVTATTDNTAATTANTAALTTATTTTTPSGIGTAGYGAPNGSIAAPSGSGSSSSSSSSSGITAATPGDFAAGTASGTFASAGAGFQQGSSYKAADVSSLNPTNALSSIKHEGTPSKNGAVVNGQFIPAGYYVKQADGGTVYEPTTFRDGGDLYQRARNGLDSFVPGGSGVDSRLVRLAVSPGESIHVRTPQQRQAAARAQQGGGGNTQITVVTPDANSFRRSAHQIAGSVYRSQRRINRKFSGS